MNKVITINLNGRAYQLEEDAYNYLRAYLDRAVTKLAENPDKAEIVADLEQAIAEKCDKYLNRHKNVMKAVEVDQIIKEMGEVKDPSEASENHGDDEKKKEHTKSETNAAPKRLYRIHEGSMIGGVCTGLAAYFNVDVVFIRIIFVILGFITHGGAIFLYFLMMIFIPNANTGEERAAAYGRPFTAQELIDRAKDGYNKFYSYSQREWRKHEREMRRARRMHNPWNWNWNHARKTTANADAAQTHTSESASTASEYPPYPQHPPRRHYPWVRHGSQVFGFAVAMLSLIWVATLVDLIATGTFFGVIIPGNLPLWILILGLICIYNIVIYPLKRIEWVLDRSMGHQDYYDDGWFGFMMGIMWLGIFAFVFWALYQYVPGTHPFFDKAITWWHNAIQNIQNAVRK